MLSIDKADEVVEDRRSNLGARVPQNWPPAKSHPNLAKPIAGAGLETGVAVRFSISKHCDRVWQRQTDSCIQCMRQIGNCVTRETKVHCATETTAGQ